jgi:hypothetical protein
MFDKKLQKDKKNEKKIWFIVLFDLLLKCSKREVCILKSKIIMTSGKRSVLDAFSCILITLNEAKSV